MLFGCSSCAPDACPFTGCAGARQNLSSDIAFVRDILINPLRSVLDTLSDEQTRQLHIGSANLDDPDMQGMLVQSVRITVCPLLSSQQTISSCSR